MLGTNVAKMGQNALGLTALGLATLASACGGGGGNDAGPSTSNDAFVVSGEDASGGYTCPIPASLGGCVELSTGETGSGAADFSDRGTRTAPSPGDSVNINFRLTVFGMDGQVARRTRVQFFADNDITDTCTAPACQEFETGMDGTFSPVMANAGGWYAYRVFENTTGGTAATRYTDSVQYNELTPSAGGAMVDGNAVAFSTLDLIPLSLGLEREPGTTILAGRVQDATGTNVGGAFVRAFRADGTEILDAGEVSSTGPHYRYFRRIGADSNPSNEQLYTNYEGLYAAMNIPASADLVRVETWGIVAGDSAPSLLGCEAVRTLADGVTIINIQSLRSDYEAGHPCARYL